MKDTNSIQCPKCRAISYNPIDIKHKYCGRCHEFWGDIQAHVLGEVTEENVEAINKVIEVAHNQLKLL